LSHARFTPSRGFAGGIEERIGGSLKRIASRSQTAGIRPHFARLRRGFTIDVRGWWSSLWDRFERNIRFFIFPRSGIEDSREFQYSQIPGKVFVFLLMLSFMPPESPKGRAGPVCYGINVRQSLNLSRLLRDKREIGF